MPQNPFIPPVHLPLPPELSDRPSLMAYLGISDKELAKIRWFRGGMYHRFNIAKKNGKVREICAPDERLKFLQTKLLPLINQLYRVRHPVHGFVPNKSVKTNANSHLRKKYLLNIDLQDFFPTITENRVSGVLSAVGVDDNVADVVATICCCFGHLPQGAPTSPTLSNMVCFRLDRELMQFAKKSRCIYTRYADDITFSSFQPMSTMFEGKVPPAGNIKPQHLSAPLLQIVSANGFRINQEKVHFADKHSRKIVTGLKVNEILNVDRRFVRNIRAILHSVEQDGAEDAQKKFNSLGKIGDLRRHVRGKIEWLSNVKGGTDPVVRSIIRRYNECYPAYPMKIAPTDEERLERAIWITENENGQGTLFFLEGVGLVTAAHCVANLAEVEFFHPSKHSNKYKAKVETYDDHCDLAVLSHSVPSTDFYELLQSKDELAAGNEVTALGYPDWGFGDPLNIRPGVVSAITVKSAVRLIEVNQKLAKGMSGGPLLNNYNEVVGIIHKGGALEDRDFAVHREMLKTILDN